MKSWEYQEAIFASNLSSNAKLVALAISSYYNWKKKESCWPSNQAIAKSTGLSISSVTRAKKELVSQGYLWSQRRYDSSNKYEPMLTESRGYGHTEQSLWSERPTNNEVNNEVNNVLSKSSFQSDFDTVILKDIITEEIKDIEDDSANWTDAQRRAWFLSQPLGTNKDSGESRPVSTRDNRYVKAVPGFLQDIEEARANQW